MKIHTYLTLSLVVLLAACSKDTVSPSGVSYQQSLSNWYAYKYQLKNNYTYTVATYSWIGTRTETKLTVQSGKVTARDYKATRQIAQNSPVDSVYKAWTETAANLNTHGQYEGAEILTMDEVYTKAKNVWLKADVSANRVIFDTDSKGILSSCGYTPINCADDCFNGITIKEIVGL
jgi:hypothetical protein